MLNFGCTGGEYEENVQPGSKTAAQSIYLFIYFLKTSASHSSIRIVSIKYVCPLKLLNHVMLY